MRIFTTRNYQRADSFISMINLHLFSYLTFHAVLVVSYFTQYYTGKYGPETTPYLDTFHAVLVTMNARTKDVIRKLNT